MQNITFDKTSFVLFRVVYLQSNSSMDGIIFFCTVDFLMRKQDHNLVGRIPPLR